MVLVHRTSLSDACAGQTHRNWNVLDGRAPRPSIVIELENRKPCSSVEQKCSWSIFSKVLHTAVRGCELEASIARERPIACASASVREEMIARTTANAVQPSGGSPSGPVQFCTGLPIF